MASGVLCSIIVVLKVKGQVFSMFVGFLLLLSLLLSAFSYQFICYLPFSAVQLTIIILIVLHTVFDFNLMLLKE